MFARYPLKNQRSSFSRFENTPKHAFPQHFQRNDLYRSFAESLADSPRSEIARPMFVSPSGTPEGATTPGEGGHGTRDKPWHEARALQQPIPAGAAAGAGRTFAQPLSFHGEFHLSPGGNVRRAPGLLHTWTVHAASSWPPGGTHCPPAPLLIGWHGRLARG